jgi:hypothetical protein
MTSKAPDAIFRAFKPLSNQLYKLNFSESLYVFWALAEFYEHRRLIPRDIVVPDQILLSRDLKERPLHMWDLELLVRELIIHEGGKMDPSQSLTRASNLANLVNKLRAVNETIGAAINTQAREELFVRIPHQQFAWQEDIDPAYITRYFKIWSDPKLDKLVREVHGFTVHELYSHGVALWGYFLSNSFFAPEAPIRVTTLTADSIKRFLEIVALPRESLAMRLRKERNIDTNFLYSRGSQRRYPLIRFAHAGTTRYSCPLTRLLIWRLSVGLYYDLCDQEGFGNVYGNSFQRYIGEVLDDGAAHTRVLPEERFRARAGHKDTIDWIVDDGTAALFIECKTKRLQAASVIELASRQRADDLGILADAVEQSYKSLRDHLDGYYPSFQVDTGRRIFPLVVTLEDWIVWGPDITNELDELVQERLHKSNIPPEWLTTYPYTVCAAKELEVLKQIVNKRGITAVLSKRFTSDYRRLSLGRYLASEYTDDYAAFRFRFEDVFESIYSPMLSESD